MSGISALSPFISPSPVSIRTGRRGHATQPAARADRRPAPAVTTAPDPGARTRPAASTAPLVGTAVSALPPTSPGRYSSQQAIGHYQAIGHLPDPGDAEVIPRIDRRV